MVHKEVQEQPMDLYQVVAELMSKFVTRRQKFKNLVGQKADGISRGSVMQAGAGVAFIAFSSDNSPILIAGGWPFGVAGVVHSSTAGQGGTQPGESVPLVMFSHRVKVDSLASIVVVVVVIMVMVLIRQQILVVVALFVNGGIGGGFHLHCS